jgi:glutathione synthase/RimK-type ligase-like ATP-grasp enzyme
VIKNLAWVTTRAAHGRDEDETAVVAALGLAGCAVEIVNWDDKTVNWSKFNRVVLRSAWDYPERLTEFLTWFDRVAAITEVVNSPAIVRWNLDKNYLNELADARIPITPTVFVKPGDVYEYPIGEFVIKPAIGAGSRDAASYDANQHEIATRHVARLHASGQTVLVQPLLHSIAKDGEWPMVFFGGKFSHAANKRVSLPRAGTVDDLFAAETNTTHIATVPQIEVAQAAIDLVSNKFGPPTYSRVDLVLDNQDNFCVLELELIEPSLFLCYAHAKCTQSFVEALIQ